MIFSGVERLYRCETCATNYAYTTPTSVLAFTAVVMITTGPWARVVSRFVPLRWLSVILAIGVATVSLWVICSVIEPRMNGGPLSCGLCPKCGAKLTRSEVSFYDGMVPTASEVVTYLIALTLAFGAATAAWFFR